MAVEAVVLNYPAGNPRVSQWELEALAGLHLPKGKQRKYARRKPGTKTRKRRSTMKRNSTARQKAYRAIVKKHGVKKGSSIWRKKKGKPTKKRTSKKLSARAKRGVKTATKRAGFRSPSRYMTQLSLISAAKRGGRKKPSRLRRKKPRIAVNKGKRRYKKNILTNKKRVRRNYYMPVGGNRVRRNKGNMKAFTAGVKDVFTVDTLVDGLQITSGGMLAVAVPNLIMNAKFMVNKEGKNRVPEVLRTGWGKYLINLVATGLVSGAATYFGKTKIAKNLLLGGVSGTLTSVVSEQLGKFSVKNPDSQVAKIASQAGLTGMGILTQDVETAVEAAVEEELARQGIGMGDYLVPAETESPGMVGMDDYLVPAETDNPGMVGMADYLVPEETMDPGVGIIT